MNFSPIKAFPKALGQSCSLTAFMYQLDIVFRILGYSETLVTRMSPSPFTNHRKELKHLSNLDCYGCKDREGSE